jgi:guanylate kinase
MLQALQPEQVGVKRVVSYTTRPPRPGERDGVDYHFVDAATIHSMAAAGALVECTEFIPGRLYATPRQAVDEALAAGQDVLIKPEVLGAAKVKAAYPDAVTIFLAPPSMEEARRRMSERGSETAGDAKARVHAMTREFAATPNYDYVIVNETGKLDAAVAQVKALITAEQEKRRAPTRPH